MFSWWFNWFFGITNVYQCLFTLNILFDEVNRGLGHEKKIFLKKSCHGWLKVMTCSYTWWLCVNNITGHHIKRVGVLLQERSSLTLDISPSRKALKGLLQNMYLILDLSKIDFYITPLWLLLMLTFFKKYLRHTTLRKTLEEDIIFIRVLQYWNYN